MAPPPGTQRVWRYFVALAVIVAALYAIVFFPGQRHTPKLGIDLVGGTRVILTARSPDGKPPSSTSMQQARDIIEQRVNGTGVTQSTVQVQAGNQIVVSIPGGTNTDVASIGQAAKLNFRGLVSPSAPVSCTTGRGGSTTPGTSPGASTGASGSPSSGASQSPNDYRSRILAAPKTKSPKTAKNTGGSASSSPTGSASTTSPTAPATTSAPPAPCTSKPFAALLADKSFSVPLSDSDFGKLSQTQQTALVTALSHYDCRSAVDEADVNDTYYVACDPTGQLAFLLGPVIVPGTQISSAAATAPNGTTQTQYAVQLNLKGSGSAAWAKYTTANNVSQLDSSVTAQAQPYTCSATTVPCADFVGFTLNGQVISYPVNQTPINGQATQITGNFTQASATALADQLKFGALPLSFRVDDNEHVSATLGTTQLKAALLAGGIGLVLVVLYSLFYYRALGFITIASLLVSGGLTYAMLVILGKQIGFTLDLSGTAGFIVALGITADSFVVFFERIKDEVHEGRSARTAVPRAWVRARRTILSADTVSFLAAFVLYFFASADVKGFAFTLGLSTILDIIVVFLFTHPIVLVLSRSRAFGSARFTGLNSVREGGMVASAEDAPRVRSAARARPEATSAERAAARRGRTATVVLEKTEIETDEGLDDVAADEPVDEVEAVTVIDSDVEDAPPPPRRTSGGGTAAERAAARRARQREQRGEN